MPEGCMAATNPATMWRFTILYVTQNYLQNNCWTVFVKNERWLFRHLFKEIKSMYFVNTTALTFVYLLSVLSIITRFCLRIFCFIARVCDNPPTIDNGKLTGNTNGYFFGSVYYIRCNNGYEISGSPILTCNTVGQWNTSSRCIGKVWFIKMYQPVWKILTTFISLLYTLVVFLSSSAIYRYGYTIYTIALVQSFSNILKTKSHSQTIGIFTLKHKVVILQFWWNLFRYL